MNSTFQYNKPRQHWLWILTTAIIISMPFPATSTPCSVCEYLNPDHDPTNPYESDPLCLPRPDGTVINDCVSKEEKLLSSGNQCFSQWRVYWKEKFGFTPPGGTSTGSGSLWKRQPEVVMEKSFFSTYICITESEVCEGGTSKKVYDDGVFSRQEVYRRKMDVSWGNWQPFVRITIHWYFGQYTVEKPPRRDPPNPMPCMWKTPVPCRCP